MNRLLPTVFTLTLLVAATAAAEETVVYKVTHADGTVSYSQDPVEGAEKRVVSSSGASSRAQDDPSLPRTPIPDEIQPGTAEEKAARAEACANASANLAVYRSSESVTVAQGDSQVTLTGADLESARAKAQVQVNLYCKPAADGG